jgi:hypothetical protein
MYTPSMEEYPQMFCSHIIEVANPHSRWIRTYMSIFYPFLQSHGTIVFMVVLIHKALTLATAICMSAAIVYVKGHLQTRHDQ